MANGIQARIKIQTISQIEKSFSTPTLLTSRVTADVVDHLKKQMLYEIKERASKLTVEDLEFTEVNIPYPYD